jgi:hypothetical protein
MDTEIILAVAEVEASGGTTGTFEDLLHHGTSFPALSRCDQKCI